MSDAIKHECGIALLRLKKPLEFYKEKYGTAFYGIKKMYLLMEKQHNRGQDGAGFASIKLDVEPGERYISRVRSNAAQPIQDVFSQINERINDELAANPEYAEKRRLQSKEWFKNNTGVAKAKRARRRASERNATPDWLTAIHKAQIDQFYEVSTALDMQTGVKHHVDHIVPLKAKIASGLHVPWNLQILTATENLRKNNSYGTH
jgi:hypothetical protein